MSKNNSLRDALKKLYFGINYGMGAAKLKGITADRYNDPYYRHDDELCSCREWINYSQQSAFYSLGAVEIGPPKEGCENCEGYGTKPIPFGELLSG
jgi:hypothetical protein